MNRDLLYLDGPSRTCLDSIWRSHAIYGGYGITDLYLLWWMAGSTIMLTVELLSWRIQQIVMFKSNFWLQCDTSPGYLYMMTTQTCGDTLSVQGPMRKSNEMHLLNLGGQNDWGSCLPAFQSLLCVNTKCQSWPLKYFERRYYKLRHIWGKNRYEQPIVVCHLVFCWHAKGILSTFVSLSSTKDWAIHRDRQTILHNRLALLTNKCYRHCTLWRV